MKFALLLLTTCLMLLAPLAVLAQTPKDVNVLNFPDPQNVTGAVEVTNDPLSVEVVNPSPPMPASRFQLVGFTSAMFTGGQGILGFALACQEEFAGSRMCSTIEVVETVDVPNPRQVG